MCYFTPSRECVLEGVKGCNINPPSNGTKEKLAVRGSPNNGWDSASLVGLCSTCLLIKITLIAHYTTPGNRTRNAKSGARARARVFFQDCVVLPGGTQSVKLKTLSEIRITHHATRNTQHATRNTQHAQFSKVLSGKPLSGPKNRYIKVNRHVSVKTTERKNERTKCWLQIFMCPENLPVFKKTPFRRLKNAKNP